MMKKNFLKTAGVLGVLLFAGMISNVNAQDSNLIQEVNLSSKDGFQQLRNLIGLQFDYTNPNLSEGQAQSIVKFEIAENGKMKNIDAQGDCEYVNQELESVMKKLVYKFPSEMTTDKVYIMPVNLSIASR
ncbi:hypothetical protein [Bergeyella sp. RCAD1439]|uniref:hypothetical protein n=1 Tax=Bergeyella anatis TaxID=3113737 RepID=UPI002E17BB60|nr:hypothetical protein [Bergeyella sp. RCAD1439]